MDKKLIIEKAVDEGKQKEVDKICNLYFERLETLESPTDRVFDVFAGKEEIKRGIYKYVKDKGKLVSVGEIYESLNKTVNLDFSTFKLVVAEMDGVRFGNIKTLKTLDGI